MKISDQILNSALELHLEFGENWLADIDSRLSKKQPELSKTELRKIDQLCKKIAKAANEIIVNNPKEKGDKVEFMDSSEFKSRLLQDYPWISEKNLKRLYSQSCYYALK